jgi:SAM-dependent methyltransferase
MSLLRLLPSVRARERFARAALDRLPDRPRALDVGCGEGTFHPELRSRCALLAGSDANRADLEVAAAQAPAEQRPWFAVADAAAQPWPAESFDVVFCMELIEHVADAAAVLRECRRVLVPGGTLVLTCPVREFPWTYDPLHRLAGRRIVPFGAYAFGHDHLPATREVEDLLSGAGFRSAQITPLAGPLAALPEAGWVGVAQRALKPNRANQPDDAPGAWRPASGAPPGFALGLVDGLLRLDVRTAARLGGGSVGIGVIATRP